MSDNHELIKDKYWEKILSYIDVYYDGTEKMIYRSKSFLNNSHQKLSYMSVLKCVLSVFLDTRKGMVFSRGGNMVEFEWLHALMGAKSISYCNLQINVMGRGKLDPDQTYIFAPTHGSILDVFILYLILREWHLCFIAKEEFRKNPILSFIIGKAMDTCGRVFFVNREDIDSSMKIMDEVLIKLNNNRKLSLVTFPQGTRPKVKYKNGQRIDGDLFESGPLKSGVSYLALKTLHNKTPKKIVPIIINGTNRTWPSAIKPILKSQAIEITIDDPINPEDFLNERKPVKSITKKIEEIFRIHYLMQDN